MPINRTRKYWPTNRTTTRTAMMRIGFHDVLLFCKPLTVRRGVGTTGIDPVQLNAFAITIRKRPRAEMRPV